MGCRGPLSPVVYYYHFILFFGKSLVVGTNQRPYLDGYQGMHFTCPIA